jgi:L-iditol 2-dehydrogenase
MPARRPETMKAWVLGDPGRLVLTEKAVPQPGRAEVLVWVDACAICATDLEVIGHGTPASIEGGLPFNRNFTPGHEYMGTIVAVGPTVDEYSAGERVAVEVHAGCGRCERCRQGMYTSCLNYGRNFGEYDKGHRANGFTTDGGFAQYAVNHVNTLVRVSDELSDELATLIVTAGTATYGLDVLGGLIAGQSLVVIGAGPIGLMVVSVAKALGAALMAQRKIDASPVHTHTFALDELPTGLRYARDRVDGAIKVVIKPQIIRGTVVDTPVHAIAEP